MTGPTPEQELARRVERVRFLGRELDAAEAELASTRRAADRATRELERLRHRWWVRAGLRCGRLWRRLQRAPGVQDAQPQALTPSAATTMARLQAALHPDGGTALRVGVLADPPPIEGPAITVRDLASVTAAQDADVLVVTDAGVDVRAAPDGLPLVAWVQGDVAAWLDQPWFDEFDLVLAVDHDAADQITARSVHVAQPTRYGADAGAGLQAALRAWASVRHIDLAIGPPDHGVAWRWGDYHFARDLQRALQRRGHPTRLRLRDRWASPGATRADIAIQLFGLAQRPRISGQTNAIWIISHPDLVTDDLIDGADHVFVASDAFAGELARRHAREVVSLHQATDPGRFRPMSGGTAHDLLFVANARGTRRIIVEEMTPTGLDLAVYGRGWSPGFLDPRHLAGEYVPNERLPSYYSAAKVVLNDHWADMAAHGFLSNRLYDAAASGAFVISDEVRGIDREFDGGIVTFRDGSELRSLVRRYLADPDARARHAERARAAVLRDHTFDERAKVLEAHLGIAPA